MYIHIYILNGTLFDKLTYLSYLSIYQIFLGGNVWVGLWVGE